MCINYENFSCPFLVLSTMSMFTVLWTQIVQREVTGYVGHDVLLPCYLIPRPNASITQSQWELLEPSGEKTLIVVSSSPDAVHIHESPLKARVKTAEQSLQIKNVEMADAGTYICTVATFPQGSFEETVQLSVQSE